MKTQLFEILNLNDGILNFAINQEKRAKNIFKKLVASNSISEETRRSLKQVGTQVLGMDFVKFTKISSIIAHLFNLFCQKLILVPLN